MTSDWTISRRTRTGKRFSVRVWALVAVACGALAAPGVARAAGSPPGMSDLTTAVDSAFAQVDAVAPGAGAAARPAVMQAIGAASTLTSLTAGPAPPAGPPAPDLPDAAPPAAVAPTAVMASVLVPASVPSTAIPPAADALGLRDAAGAGVDRPEPAATPARAVLPQAASGRHASLTPALVDTAPAVFTPKTPGAAPDGVGPGARRSGGRSASDPPAGSTSPRPLPPVPQGPEGPGLTSPGLGGVPGPLLPLLVAALAAALAFASFPFVSRRLPRSAFRKPRRVALAVWHPG
jgi:hypothetical protein